MFAPLAVILSIFLVAIARAAIVARLLAFALRNAFLQLPFGIW